MTKQKTTKTEGFGKFRFVLGRGVSGVFGHVELLLHTVPDPGHYSVHWQVNTTNHAVDAQEKVVNAASEYLRQYVGGHPEYGFQALITQVTSDTERQNDYERAARLALRFALEEMDLPVPPIFGL